jgi:5,10-methylenetetrahydromethanopterin reductase
MAARGAKALELCGEIADGLVISNMCPPGFAAHAAAVVAKAAAKAGRPAPRNIVHYVPCVANADGAAARRGAAAALTGMLKQYWALAQKVPAAKEGMVQYSGIPEADFQTAVDALQAGTPPEVALDRRFLDAFAVAGTDEECLVRIAAYGQAGVSDLVLTFVGPDPIADMTYLGRALPPD